MSIRPLKTAVRTPLSQKRGPLKTRGKTQKTGIDISPRRVYNSIMRKLVTILCDDDAETLDITAKAIEETFARYGAAASIDAFASVGAFYGALGKRPYDVIFLDIDMPGADGISLGMKLRKEGRDAEIVYISSREDRMHDAFKVQPFAFIRKNKFLPDCAETVTRLIRRFGSESEENTLVLRSGGSVENIATADVMYIESLDGVQYIHLHSVPEPMRTREKLGDLESMLSDRGFIRTHKGYIVNLAYMRRADITSVTLSDGTVIPVSRQKTKDVRNEFLKFLRIRTSL